MKKLTPFFSAKYQLLRRRTIWLRSITKDTRILYLGLKRRQFYDSKTFKGSIRCSEEKEINYMNKLNHSGSSGIRPEGKECRF